MTDEISEFKHVPHHEVEAHEAEGWRVCDGWRNYGHHLRYSLPMERTEANRVMRERRAG